MKDTPGARARTGLLGAAALFAMVAMACERRAESAALDATPTAPTACVGPAVPSAAPHAPLVDAAVDAPPAPAPGGDVGLLIQRVVRQSECGHDVLGYDLLLETKLAGATKATRTAVFCPPGKKDMFEMCRPFRRCAVEPDDGGGDDRAAVRCDGDVFTIEATDAKTHVSGPKLESEVAPARLRIVPTKKVDRTAYVDC